MGIADIAGTQIYSRKADGSLLQMKAQLKTIAQSSRANRNSVTRNISD